MKTTRRWFIGTFVAGFLGVAAAALGGYSSGGSATSVVANSVALGTDTTGNYAAGDAEAGNALTGDSATSFFSAGQIEAARGGTGQDSSGQTGVPFISAGTWAFGNIAESYVTNLPTDLANLATQIGSGGGSSPNVGSSTTSGCGFANTTGLVYAISACTYYINGTAYTSPAATVTLTAADGSNPRIDSLIVDTTSTAGKVDGTASANPSEPSIDPATQLRIASVSIAAGATTPTGLTSESIYAENIEWTSTAGTGSSFTDTGNPHGGTKDLKFTAVAANAFAKLVRSSTLSLAAYQQLNLWIAPASSVLWPSGRSIVLTFRDANAAQLGNAITITNGSYGFSRTSTSYQLIAIPLSQFAVPASSVVKELRINPAGTGGTFTFYVDDIGLQTATSAFSLQQLDARYPLRSNNLSDLASSTTALTNLGVAAATLTETNKTLDVEATGNVVTVPSKVWLPFAACQNATAGLLWDSPTSNPAVAACITGSNTQKGVADFDPTTDQSIQTTYLLPADWTGAIDAKIFGLAAATSGAAGLCVQLVCVADAETDDPAFPAQASGNCVSDTAKGTTLQTNSATITGVTATTCAAGELMHIQFSRDANGGAVTDDMTGNWRGIGLELTIRRAL